MLGDIGDFVGSTVGEIGKHPLQALGAAFGVPGYDPFFGGLLNNHKGGALLSPTGNFTSSAWDEMKGDNPDKTAGLDLFHKVNSVADVIAPIVAGGYGASSAGLFGGGAGSGGGGLLDSIGGLFGGGSGGGAAGGVLGLPESISGGGALTGVDAGLGSGAADAGAWGVGSAPGGFAGAFSGQAYPFTMGGTSGLDMSQLVQQLQKLNQSQNQQQQQSPQQASRAPTPRGFGGGAYGAAANGGNYYPGIFPVIERGILGAGEDDGAV